MTPPIGESVFRVTQDSWSLGSSRVCERVTTSSPPRAIVTWDDGTSIFSLRERMDEDVFTTKEPLELHKIHEAGTSAAAWNVGPDVICKAKAWCSGMEPEIDAIEFVRDNVPSIPLPQVLCSWIDHKWKRSFLILRRVPGKTLLDAWPRLSASQRSNIADQVAEYCSLLAKITSSSIETATHCGVREPYFMSRPSPAHPSWMPRLLGPILVTDFTQGVAQCPEFHPLHATSMPILDQATSWFRMTES